MNHEKPYRSEGGEQTDPTRPETKPPIEPKIYVASLADYNNGHLHGAWIDANQEADAIHRATQAMLRSSPLAHRLYPPEEWAIHDYEGFHHFHLNEHTPVNIVAAIASGIAEHGVAFAHWADELDDPSVDLLAQFEDHYLGEWNSLADYAEHHIAELGLKSRLEEATPEWLLNYTDIDYEQIGNDLSHELITSHDSASKTVHIFIVPDENPSEKPDEDQT